MAGIRVTSTGDVLYTDGGDRRVVDPTFGVVQTEHTAPVFLRPLITKIHTAPLGMRDLAEASHTGPIGMRVWVNREHTAPLGLYLDSAHAGLIGMRVWVQGPHTAEPRLDVDVAHTAQWAMYVAGEHIAKTTFKFLVSHSAEVSLRVTASGSHTALFDLLDHVKVSAEHAAPWGLMVAADHTGPVGLRSTIEREHTALFDLLDYIRATAAHSAPITLSVDLGHTAPLGMRFILDAEHTAPIGDVVIVQADHIGLFDLLDYVPVWASHVAVWSLRSPAVDLQTGVPTVTVGGALVPLQSASIYTDEGSPFWQSELVLADAGDYGRFAIDTELTLTFQGIDFELLVDSRDLTRSVDARGVAQIQARIQTLSASAQYDSPRADTMTRTWDAPIMAKTAAEEALGASITWDMVDWLIPAYRLAVVDATPLAVVQSLVQAAGGLLESDPDGTLRARPRVPVSVPDLAGATPDQILTEHEINALSESSTAQRVINRVRIVDAEAAVQDRLEYEADPDNGLNGTVRAYPSPWRPVQVNHSHSSPPLRLYRVGDVSRQETQTVEIIAGTGRVSYPIISIDSVTWITNNLGALTFVPGTSDLFAATAGYSLILVTYTTRALEYRAESRIATDAQLLLEET